MSKVRVVNSEFRVTLDGNEAAYLVAALNVLDHGATSKINRFAVDLTEQFSDADPHATEILGYLTDKSLATEGSVILKVQNGTPSFVEEPEL